MNKTQSWNIIALFCIFIFGFTAATLISPQKEYSETENRTLSQKPAVSLRSLTDGSFEKEYEDYLTDQFVLRDQWNGWKTAAERAVFRQDSKDIYFGKDGYLIEKHTGTFTAGQAKSNLMLLKTFIEKYEKQFEGHLSVLIIPNAVSVLKDKLPPYAAPYEQQDYLEEIRRLLPEEVWMDAAAVLQEHSKEDIFYRTDHHWTTLGAYYVYQEWAKKQGISVWQEGQLQRKKVTEDFEGTIQSKLGIHTQKDTIELFLPADDPLYTVSKEGENVMTYSMYDEAMLDTKDKYAVFFGGNHSLIHIRTKADTGRKLLVIKDSYANCFVPFAIEAFDAIDLLDLRYYNQKVSELLEKNGYTDLLFLYNAAGFAEDTSLAKLGY